MTDKLYLAFQNLFFISSFHQHYHHFIIYLSYHHFIIIIIILSFYHLFIISSSLSSIHHHYHHFIIIIINSSSFHHFIIFLSFIYHFIISSSLSALWDARRSRDTWCCPTELGWHLPHRNPSSGLDTPALQMNQSLRWKFLMGIVDQIWGVDFWPGVLHHPFWGEKMSNYNVIIFISNSKWRKTYTIYLNVIALGQTKTDNINWMITITYDFYCHLL